MECVGLLVSVLIGEAMVWIMKGLLLRPRPLVANALVIAPGASFPSGHAFVAFCHTKGTARSIPFITFAVIAIAIGLSRIYLGAHWASDVLASYFLGAAWLALLFAVIPLFNQTGPGRFLTGTDRQPGVAWAIALALVWLAVFFTLYLSDLRGFGVQAHS